MADVDPPTHLVSGRVGLQDPVTLGVTGSCHVRARYDAVPPRRRPEVTMPRRSLLAALAALLVAVAILGCDPAPGSPAPSREPVLPSASTPATSPSAPSPSEPPASQPPPSDAVGQTDTDWGRIWDALPVGFPTYPNATPAETGEGPVSAQFSTPDGVAQVAQTLQAALERAGFSTESMSGPLEDGSMVLESVGPNSAACRAQTTIAPAGGTTLVTVLYGAECPFA